MTPAFAGGSLSASAELLALGLDFDVLPMLSALASSTRRLIGATFMGAVLVLFTGCGDQSTDHNGYGGTPNLGGGGSNAGAAGAGAAAGAQGGPVPWCDAYKIINCVCQQCHRDPTVNGAAMPLMTYEDTQAPFPLPTSSTLVWEKMQVAVKSGAMPETGNSSVVPAVKPLTDAQRDTLLNWLAQGALDEGGRNCPMTCDWSKGPPAP